MALPALAEGDPRMPDKTAAPTLRDYLTVGRAATFHGISSPRPRNRGRAGKLTASRHPMSGYRLYRRSDLEDVLRRAAARGASRR